MSETDDRHHRRRSTIDAAMMTESSLSCMKRSSASRRPLSQVALTKPPLAGKEESVRVSCPSSALWTRHAKPSRARRWRTIEVAAGELREGCQRAEGFTYNDLLATCALQFSLGGMVCMQWPPTESRPLVAG